MFDKIFPLWLHFAVAFIVTGTIIGFLNDGLRSPTVVGFVVSTMIANIILFLVRAFSKL